MTRRSSRTKLLVALLAGLTVLLAACGGTDTEPGAQTEEALPAWLVNVRPDPGAEDSTLGLVQVEHNVPTGGQNVRLLIDGVDVTSSAEFGSEERVTGPGLLVYDPMRVPQTADLPVQLDAGEHTATAELVELTDIGGTRRVIDSFTWSFSIR